LPGFKRLHISLALAPSLHGYQRVWLTGDLVAGATLLAIAVPEQLATARLAGMPPITGFYAFVAGTVLFALLGSNSKMSVGADSTIAPLFAVGVAHFAVVGSSRYTEMVGILAVMVGLIVALVWLLRLGWVSEFLSEPIITGFLAGVAVVIVVHQLPDLLGIPGASGNTVDRIAGVIRHLGDVQAGPLVIGTAVFTLVVGTAAVDRRLPGALLALIISTAVAAAARLRSHGVAVLGKVAHSPPHLGLGGLSVTKVSDLAPLAAIVALVIVTQSTATSRAFTDGHGGRANVDRDLLGVGAGNLAAGLIGAFPVNASPPRTAAVASASGRTQASGLLAAGGMALLIPVAGVLKDLPLATLAGILVFVASRIFHGRELLAIARFDRFELGLAVVTLLAVALIGVEQGIGVAVGLAILDRTRLSARPQLHVLGRIAGTTSWAPISAAQNAAQLPGVLVVLFATPLWYANAVHFQTQVRHALGRGIGSTHIVVLDALGMSDIDYTGSRALGDLLDDFDRMHITFGVARAGQRARTSLQRSGLLERIGEDHLFPSVDTAVTRLQSADGDHAA